MPATSREKLSAFFFFRPHGRIARAEYALGCGFLWCLAAGVLLFALSGADPASGLVFAAGLLVLVFTVAQFVLVAKRGHDIGLPGIFVLLLFVPVLGIGWLLFLAVMPGNKGGNAYGPPPEFRSD